MRRRALRQSGPCDLPDQSDQSDQSDLPDVKFRTTAGTPAAPHTLHPAPQAPKPQTLDPLTRCHRRSPKPCYNDRVRQGMAPKGLTG
jgi:hypothetical protein